MTRELDSLSKFTRLSEETHSDINKCDFKKYHIIKHVNIWKMSITQ